jgi:hypothetical protein
MTLSGAALTWAFKPDPSSDSTILRIAEGLFAVWSVTGVFISETGPNIHSQDKPESSRSERSPSSRLTQPSGDKSSHSGKTSHSCDIFNSGYPANFVSGMGYSGFTHANNRFLF